MFQIKNTLKILFIGILCAQVSLANGPYCEKSNNNDPHLQESDFIWNYTLELLKTAFDHIYQSNDKRLPARAYWDSNRKLFILPYLPERGGDVILNANFIRNLTMHIESAFQNKYIESVFFPDMGHSHFLIPDQIWKSKYDKYPVNQFSKLYTDLFSDPELKILYHTAEQLQLIDENKNVLNDSYIQWRHHTRNIVGTNNGDNNLIVLQNSESPSNTVNGLDHHFWYGAGYNISSNQNGCFQYTKNGQIFKFDISLFDLE